MSMALRSRVQRLLSGEIREQDLHRLFLSIREESGGSGLVSEIAHFLAHPSVRTRGIAWHEVRDMFVFLKFRESLKRRRIFTTDFPASMPDAMRANLRRMRQPILKRETGLNRNDAEKVLEAVLARAIPTPGGVKIGALSEREAKTFVCISSHAKAGPLFDDSDLFEDFCRALQKQSILRSSEKHSLKKRNQQSPCLLSLPCTMRPLIWAMEAPLRSKSPPTSKAD